jgi:plasmid stabilization system protein ParE
MYDIVWTNTAHDQMSRIVQLHPHSRARFSAALRKANKELRSHPNDCGESRFPGFRVAFFEGLTIWFGVFPERMSVVISRVYHTRRAA